MTGRLFFGENFGPFAGPGEQATAVVHGPTAEPGIVPLLSSKVARSFPRRQTIRITITFLNDRRETNRELSGNGLNASPTFETFSVPVCLPGSSTNI